MSLIFDFALRFAARGPFDYAQGRAGCVAPTGLACVFNFSQALRPGLNNFTPSGLEYF